MSGYDYGNARLRVMKSRLFAPSELASLAEARTLQNLIAALTRTPYRKAIDSALARTAGGLECIAEALHLDLVENLSQMRQFYEGQARELVLIVLRQYDVHNVKVILRAKSRFASPIDISRALLPVGELSQGVLDELIRAPDLRAAIDTLVTMRLSIAQPLLRVRAEHPGADVPEMELALDRWHFHEARQSLKASRDGGAAILSGALNLEADIANLLIVLRFASDPAERQMLRLTLAGGSLADLLVEPGTVPMETLVQAGEQSTLEAAVEILASTPYQAPLNAGLLRYRRSERLSEFERALAAYKLRWMAVLIGRDPLGIGVPLGYLALKTNEVANLRWIAQGIDMGLTPDAIKADLELVQ
jgi:V/A-type H+-transporting ATPase subunit C